MGDYTIIGDTIYTALAVAAVFTILIGFKIIKIHKHINKAEQADDTDGWWVGS